MDNLLTGQFPGTIFPVNVKPTHFAGLTTYPSVSAIDESIDLVVIMVPAAIVPEVLHQAGERGAKAAVIISAGFKEVGEAGAALERELVKIADHYGITLIGPNCIGVINPHAHLNASFAGTDASRGSVALVSQSGALGTALLDLAKTHGLGFSKFITVGNKAGLHELELLQYLVADEQTNVTALYVESLLPNAEWVTEVRRLTSLGPHRKPIVVLKAGRSTAGAAASASHTGSLTGDDAVYQTFFEQAGVIAVQSVEELLIVAQGLSVAQVPRVAGSVIVTNAGGPGILATDAAERLRLPLAKLSGQTDQALSIVLPTSAARHNPVDILGDADADRYEQALQIIAKDQAVGSVAVIVTPQTMTDDKKIATVIKKVQVEHPHLSIAVALSGDALLQDGRAILQAAKIAVMDYPEQAMLLLSALEQQRHNALRPAVHFERHEANTARADAAIVQALHATRSALSIEEVFRVLSAYAIPMARSRIVASSIEAVQIAHSINKPVVLKIVSPDILHKTDVGGVRTALIPSHVAAAYRELLASVKNHAPSAHIEGVLVQEMVPIHQELIVGAKRDPVFGPVVLVGLGGIYVEVLKDIAMRIAPLAREDAEAMLQALKSAPLLNGTRGQKGVDKKALVDVILKVAELMLNHPEIAEIDLNPIVADEPGKGATVLDARILLGS